MGTAALAGHANGSLATPPPSISLAQCSTDPEGLAQAAKFQVKLAKFHDDMYGIPNGVMFVAENDVQGHLAEAAQFQKSNTSRMLQEATEALASLKDYRARLDKLALDLDALKRGVPITSSPTFGRLVKAALADIDGGVAKLWQAGTSWESAANAFLALDYNTADSGMESGALSYGDAAMAISAGEKTINAALEQLQQDVSCKDDASAVAPMSATQVSTMAGGGGTQHGGGKALWILAPKRLKLHKHGPTMLPMTLTASKAGIIELWLHRGSKLILNMHAIVLRSGRYGLRLVVPKSSAQTALRLKVNFIAGTRRVSQSITLVIRTA
ncbi:MAG TPA: hypothetical protein VMU39_25575 [Solirubrobacteraceae bacterium]|nr:hypothetical protein [Solirubrobacteraceae bacterium]